MNDMRADNLDHKVEKKIDVSDFTIDYFDRETESTEAYMSLPRVKYNISGTILTKII